MLTADKDRAVSGAVPYVLAACTAVSVLSTDLFTPSIPDLPAIFNTDIGTVQLAVSVNLLAYSLAQLVHGPVADAIGRRRLLLVAFTLFATISAFCAMAPSIEALLAGRFAQGLMSSVPSVVVILLIRELFEPQRAIKAMALYGAALGLAPAMGPLIGGYLHIWFGWSASFWLIAALAALAAIAFACTVPESLKTPKNLHVRGAFRTYLQLLARPEFLAQLCPQALIFGAFYAFVTTGPVVFIDIFGLPTERYGLAYVVIIAAFVVGNIWAGRLAKHTSAAEITKLAIRFAVGGGFLFLAISLTGIATTVTILSAMSVYAVGLGMILAAGPLVLLDTVSDLPQGSASALLGSAQLGAASLAGFLSGSFYSGDASSMLMTMGGFIFIGAVPQMRRALRHAR